mmetsp:Transcript_17879/g.27646  ORF Transcript_17879/g.27646 Transcript_17879/m.27646 type:complete len:140 (+) Transcript_17879:686-1105(+)
MITSPTGFDHFVLDLIQNPNKDSATAHYDVDLVQSFSFYIGAASIGYNFGTREVKVSIVCGAEEMSLESSDAVEYLQLKQQSSAIIIQDGVYKNYFVNTMSEMCPTITYEVAFVTLQKDGDEIELTVDDYRSVEEKEFL